MFEYEILGLTFTTRWELGALLVLFCISFNYISKAAFRTLLNSNKGKHEIH